MKEIHFRVFRRENCLSFILARARSINQGVKCKPLLSDYALIAVHSGAHVHHE